MLAVLLTIGTLSLVSVNAMTVDFAPDALNVESQRKYFTVYLELPSGDVNDIDIPTLVLKPNGFSIHVDTEAPTTIGDYDNDGVPDLMVKFPADQMYDYFCMRGDVVLTVRGKLIDGTEIGGSDIVRIFEK